MAETIQEWLVSLKYQVDQASQKQAEDLAKRARAGAQLTAEEFKQLEKAMNRAANTAEKEHRRMAREAEMHGRRFATTVSTVIRPSITQLATAIGGLTAATFGVRAFEDLVKQLQKTGDLARELNTSGLAINSVARAFGNLGASREQAVGFLRDLENSVLKNRGIVSQLRAMGVTATDAIGRTRQLSDAAKRLTRELGSDQAIKWFESVGLGIEAYKYHLHLSNEALDRQIKLRRDWRLDVPKDIEVAQKLREAFGDLGTEVEGVSTRVFVPIIRLLNDRIREFNTYLDQHRDEILDFFSGIGESIAGWANEKVDQLAQYIKKLTGPDGADERQAWVNWWGTIKSEVNDVLAAVKAVSDGILFVARQIETVRRGARRLHMTPSEVYEDIQRERAGNQGRVTAGGAEYGPPIPPGIGEEQGPPIPDDLKPSFWQRFKRRFSRPGAQASTSREWVDPPPGFGENNAEVKATTENTEEVKKNTEELKKQREGSLFRSAVDAVTGYIKNLVGMGGSDTGIGGSGGAGGGGLGGANVGGGLGGIGPAARGGVGRGGMPTGPGKMVGANVSGFQGLGANAAAQYASILGNRESGNVYNKRNTLGYSGRWQMGAAALKDTGYVTTTSNAALSNPNVWTGKGGINSLQDFLNNKGGVQDRQFVEYTNRNYAALERNGIIKPGMSPSQVAGYLAAAHLGGPGGAAKLARGGGSTDAYGTSTSSYFNMMKGVSDVSAGSSPEARGADPRIAEIVGAAQKYLPPGYRIETTSGFRGGTRQSFHGHGKANDFHIVGPDGKVISNRGEDPTGLYQQLARGAYTEQLKRYPELTGKFAWGGAFGTQLGGGGVRDLMHFDLGGERGRYEQYRLSNMGPLEAMDKAMNGAPPVSTPPNVSNDNSRSVNQTNTYNTNIQAQDARAAASIFQGSAENINRINMGQIRTVTR